MAAESRRNFVWLSRRFLGIFFRSNSKENKKPSFYRILGLKTASFWLAFSAKNPVKSNKLALIQGKLLNLMFLDIYISVVPIENWLRETRNQRQKTLKVASLAPKAWLNHGLPGCKPGLTNQTFLVFKPGLPDFTTCAKSLVSHLITRRTRLNLVREALEQISLAK